ncbi:hypothetical protein PRUB_a0884 [Pseudoalteromonas rubra]|uniref:Uncharacterized protein n=1 Tax=Pseudoalteromonas rubra TaxID=43658 RepID=A0A8T0C6P1_9GAMM|nr:hypothetical protein [Pseudoalteromonas rubra]KAF7786349.1 hypothetical protein PRUB_a0884 [Pseudoalteromonas rubra]
MTEKQWCGYLLCILSVCSSALANDEVVHRQGSVPLVGITLVDSIDSDIEEPNEASGGAMEMQRFFATLVVGKLNNCLKSVQSSFEQWMKAQKLLASKEVVAADKFNLLIISRDKKGLFDTGYVVDKDMSYVRVYIDYFDISGNKLAIEAIESVIKDYDLSDLWSDLKESMECI